MWWTRELAALTAVAAAYVAASYTVGFTFVAAAFLGDLAHTPGRLLLATPLVAIPFAFFSMYFTALPLLMVITLEAALRYELNLYGWCIGSAMWSIIAGLPVFSAGDPKYGLFLAVVTGLSGGYVFHRVRSKLRRLFLL